MSTSHTLADSFVSPLREIEREVQQRAKDRAIDVGTPPGREAIATLVHEAIARWNIDHQRGLRAVAIADPAALSDRLLRNVAGYGPLDPLLQDDDVWEIMVNSPSAIFVKRHSGPSGFHDEVFHDDDHVERTLTKILDDATTGHRKLDPNEGLQDAQLANGARLHIVHGDLARGGHLLVNIRKFTGVAMRTLDELVGIGTLTVAAANFLRACVRARLSILFAGAPGSGKTTMLNCCASELDPSLRVVVAEEVLEADLPLANVAQMQTRAPRVDRAGIDLRRLVAGFLRMAPDIAIVSEVRDQEALPLLLTLSSGVKGFTTIHAGSARQALTRLRFLAQLAERGSQLPLAALNQLVSEAVDVVVHLARNGNSVAVTSIVTVEELAGGPDAMQFTATELFTRGATGALQWTGQLPVRAARVLGNAGVEVRAVLDDHRSERVGAR